MLKQVIDIFILVKSFDFLDITKTIKAKLREKQYDDVGYCYWININPNNIKEDIFQIDHISSKFKLNQFEFNSSKNMNFSSYLLPEDIYLDCGHTRYCGLLRVIITNFLIK